ncbi:MAG: alpha-L-arabinofuranosidase C-terminal domain-containing protein, partial [Tepidisphaeraceae bacterium]
MILVLFGGVFGGVVFAADVTLTNPGFETKASKGWSVHIYGAPAVVTLDDQVKHGGERSLRIASDHPSDAALGQEATLRPSQWYRFSGWVRTRGLDPKDARASGTYKIQYPGGGRILAAGENHRGDTDWTQVSIVFQSPADGRVRVAPFFAGYGKGIGTAWFDDVSIEPIDIAGLPARITREALTGGEISPFQYGQFIEYLCDSVPAMWAEKLYDGSFEGLSPYKVAYLKETDFREKPWYPSGATNRATYSLSNVNPVSGKVAQEINLIGDAPAVVGIAQDGIAVQVGRVLRFSCYLRSDADPRPVQVTLHRDGIRLASATLTAGGDWKKQNATLTPTATADRATFSIEFCGPGKLWIDSASLMPEDAVAGWRRDVVNAVKAVKPGIIRFGGSALDAPDYGDFEWRDTVGDPDRRTPFRACGGLQPTGPGLEEIVQFCDLVEAEAMICVRTLGRSPKDAADQVEYFNGSIVTPMGRLRAGNGHAAPYAVKFWQIGNERTDAEYEAQLRPFAEAMRKVDPSIQLLSSFPSEGTLRHAGELLDAIAPHQYDVMNLAGAEGELNALRDLIRRFAPSRSIKIAITEWNTTAGDFGPARARLWSLENALAVARYHNLLHRHCDVVEIANRSNLSNSFCSGMIQTDTHRHYKTPAYYAQQLYATLAGNRPLKVESLVPPAVAPDFSATLSA